MEGRMDGQSARRMSRGVDSMGISPADCQRSGVILSAPASGQVAAILRSATRHGDSSIIHDGAPSPARRRFFQPPATTCVPQTAGFSASRDLLARCQWMFSITQSQQQQFCLRIRLRNALHQQRFSIFDGRRNIECNSTLCSKSTFMNI